VPRTAMLALLIAAIADRRAEIQETDERRP
jgi:hypothetical protein